MLLWVFLQLWLVREEVAGEEVVVTRAMRRMREVLACPFTEEAASDLYAYKLPIFVLLLLNSWFLLRIMGIVVAKLRAQTALDHDRRHFKVMQQLPSLP